MRRAERNVTAAETARSAAQAQDDRRDLARFSQTLAAFDAAVQRRDAAGVRAALQRFVAQGRIELQEQRRETVQASNELARSRGEAVRDGTARDRVNARDDRRDLNRERAELIEETNLVNELERIAGAEIVFGPQPGILARARSAMVRFTELAAIELRRSRQELREDRRELREDQRSLNRARMR
jgi:hypothetical protein